MSARDRNNGLTIAIAVIAVLAVSLVALLWRGGSSSKPPAVVSGEDTTREQIVPASLLGAKFTGGDKCTECHQQEAELWKGSHHDLAMQIADEDTVLGNFDNVTINYAGITSKFIKSNGSFYVNTDGIDGELKDFEIKYTFGVTPLQQYLVEFPDGRIQTLPFCWDSRPPETGGQRWFHIYPDENVDYKDQLHWTGMYQNWNFMCAECHSTNLERNYNPETNTYKSTWSEINVSCEACHGPGSEHLKWAEAVNGRDQSQKYPSMGLVVQLKDKDKGVWIHNSETGIANRTVKRTNHSQIETCARCHSRRSPIHAPYTYGKSLLDTHNLALLDESLYHADGQILDEVYVYGSFIQSKMHAEGVTCSDCHEPHSIKMRSEGNALCFKCHLPVKYDTTDHHFHNPLGEGGKCVSCHMPSRMYMVVDKRYDHSFRVPRPDLSEKLGSPNACVQCHEDESSLWAATQVRNWYGEDRRKEKHYGEAIHAGRAGEPGAEAKLIELANDSAQPAIARATSLSLLANYPTEKSLEAVRSGLKSEEALVRVSALNALEFVMPADRIDLAFHLLADPVRLVRINAGRMLATVPRNLLTGKQREILEKAIAEDIEAELVNADRPESHLNLGNLYVSLERYEEAETAYRTAIRLAPAQPVGYVNLSDMLRLVNRDDEGEALLREGLAVLPDNAALNHSFGLLQIRLGQTKEAISLLKKAVENEPANARYSYVYAIALDSTGSKEDAITTLEKALVHNPYDRAILTALVEYLRAIRDPNSALQFASTLVELFPEDPYLNQMIKDIQREVDQ